MPGTAAGARKGWKVRNGKGGVKVTAALVRSYASRAELLAEVRSGKVRSA